MLLFVVVVVVVDGSLKQSISIFFVFLVFHVFSFLAYMHFCLFTCHMCDIRIEQYVVVVFSLSFFLFLLFYNFFLQTFLFLTVVLIPVKCSPFSCQTRVFHMFVQSSSYEATDGHFVLL